MQGQGSLAGLTHRGSLSKLIPRTHEDYVLNARLCGAAAGSDNETVFLAILPLGHNYNLASPGLLVTFYCGGSVALAQGTGAEEVFARVEREQVTVIAAVVPLISAWVHLQAPRSFNLSSLKVVQSGGARLPPELRRRLRELLGCVPKEIYGTVEGLINMTRLNDPEDLLMNSLGAPGITRQPKVSGWLGFAWVGPAHLQEIFVKRLWGPQWTEICSQQSRDTASPQVRHRCGMSRKE